MHINLFLIPFVVFLGVIFGLTDSPRTRKWYVFICIAALMFVAAMRSPDFMTNNYNLDTLSYQWLFDSSFDMGWEEFWKAVIDRYSGYNDEFDVGYIGLEKLIGLVTHDFYLFSLIADLLFFVPFGILLYRYCTSIKQIVFAFVFYVALVQIFLLAGARQMFALGFDMMALLSIMKRKKIGTVLFFLLGISIHFSSILFAIPLLLLWFGVNPRALKIMHAACFIVFPIVLFMPNAIISFMGNSVGMERYANYGEGDISGGGTTFIFLVELLSLFCLIAMNIKDLAKNNSLKSFYVMAPLFTLFAPLIISNGTMIRISLYFHLYLSILVPFGIDCLFKGRIASCVYAVAICALAYLSLSGGGLTYYFFWQQI